MAPVSDAIESKRNSPPKYLRNGTSESDSSGTTDGVSSD